MHKKTFFILIIILILSFATAFTAFAGDTGGGENGTTLTADLTGDLKWTMEYTWDLQKSVTPGSWDLFRGDSGTSEYTIQVNKNAGDEKAYFQGKVCITNGGAVATEDLAIAGELKDGYGSPNDYLQNFSVDVSAHKVLAAGETYCYPVYVVINKVTGDYPQPHAGGEYKIITHITITNHSGSLGTPSGPDPSWSGPLGLGPVEVNGSVIVKDTYGGEWEVNQSSTIKYTHTFTCDADQGDNPNTAYINDKDGPSDSATVTVNCYALKVSKTADTTFDRTYKWAVEKTADQDDLILELGKSFDVNYTVTVKTTGYMDDNFAVSGQITVHNPAPIDATLNSVSDIVSTDIAADVDCGVTFPYTLPAGEDLVCDYSTDLPDATERVNTATATVQNYAYDKDLKATTGGTTDFTGQKDVKFGDPVIKDACITVKDTLAGNLGTLCVSDAPKVFNYSHTVGPYDKCGPYTVDNTATVYIPGDKDGDTILDKASWTVNITIPCMSGCTLTQGYWKTHSIKGPAPYDDAWAKIGEDTTFFLSGQSYYQVLWTQPKKGNVYYILAHQYIAAVLNGLNGAETSPVDQVLADAKTFFETKAPTDVLTKAEQKEATGWAETLDQFNNGEIGPGHCDYEPGTSGPMPSWAYTLLNGGHVVFVPVVTH